MSKYSSNLFVIILLICLSIASCSGSDVHVISIDPPTEVSPESELVDPILPNPKAEEYRRYYAGNTLVGIANDELESWQIISFQDGYVLICSDTNQEECLEYKVGEEIVYESRAWAQIVFIGEAENGFISVIIAVYDQGYEPQPYGPDFRHTEEEL